MVFFLLGVTVLKIKTKAAMLATPKTKIPLDAILSVCYTPLPQPIPHGKEEAMKRWIFTPVLALALATLTHAAANIEADPKKDYPTSTPRLELG